MSSKKYVKDYRSIDTVDSKGRLRKEFEYVGGDYFYCEDADTVQRKSKILTALCAAGWFFWLLPLLFANGSMHLPFISFPYIFAALPLWLLSMTAYTALTAREPMKRKPSVRLSKWLPGTSLAAAILSGVALLGTAAAYFFDIGSLNAYDGMFASCAALLCTDAVTCFTQRRFFHTEKR